MNSIRQLLGKNYTQAHRYFISDYAIQNKRIKQNHIAQKLRTELNPTYISVIDTTLGVNSCGAMFNIKIESPLFNGKSKVQQHQMVTKILGKDLQSIHGFNLKTKVAQNQQQQAQKTQF